MNPTLLGLEALCCLSLFRVLTVLDSRHIDLAPSVYVRKTHSKHSRSRLRQSMEMPGLPSEWLASSFPSSGVEGG